MSPEKLAALVEAANHATTAGATALIAVFTLTSLTKILIAGLWVIGLVKVAGMVTKTISQHSDSMRFAREYARFKLPGNYHDFDSSATWRDMHNSLGDL